MGDIHQLQRKAFLWGNQNLLFPLNGGMPNAKCLPALREAGRQTGF
ncbi:MAG: hypothetical protein ACKVUS_15615 [Saprospiraceae bacterium]